MKLKDPMGTQEMLLARGFPTYAATAKKIKVSPNTVGSAMEGKPVRAATMYKIAQLLGVSMSDIAEKVNGV